MSITLPRCDAQDEELRPCIRYLTHDGPHHFVGDSHPKSLSVVAVLAYTAVLFGPAVLLVLALR